MSSDALIHVLGGIGTLCVLGAYFLVSSGRVRPASRAFQGVNLLGAALLVVYSVVLAAWASVALNFVWGVIALVALSRIRRRV